MTTELWRAPSGRLHRQLHCSGGAGRRMIKVRVQDEELAKMSWPEQICMCAIDARDKAGLRVDRRTTT